MRRDSEAEASYVINTNESSRVTVKYRDKGRDTQNLSILGGGPQTGYSFRSLWEEVSLCEKGNYLAQPPSINIFRVQGGFPVFWLHAGRLAARTEGGRHGQCVNFAESLNVNDECVV